MLFIFAEVAFLNLFGVGISPERLLRASERYLKFGGLS